MRLSHLASLCLPFSCFKNCKPGSTDATAQPTHVAQPTQVAEPTQAAQPTQVAVESFETSIPTALDPTSISYLEAHGYIVWDVDVSDVGFKLYSPLYGSGIQDPILHIDLDIDHKVTTIFDNNLKHEKPDERNLELDQIFHGLCYRENIDFNEMKWIVMDVNDYSTNEAIRFYRRDSRLTDKAQIRVTPQHKDWSTFSKMHYYETAAKMIPDKEIDRIIVVQRKRETYGTEFQAVIIETLRFSFRSPSQDGETNVDPVEARAAELIAEDDLEAAVEIAENAAVAHEKAILEGETEGFPDTSLNN